MTENNILLYKTDYNKKSKINNNIIIRDENISPMYDYFYILYNKPEKQKKISIIKSGYHLIDNLTEINSIGDVEHHCEYVTENDFIKLSDKIEAKGDFTYFITKHGNVVKRVLGTGILKTSDGTTFNGIFKDGLLFKGTISWVFGQVDEGEFEYVDKIPMLLNGKKTIKLLDKEIVYDGEFLNNVIKKGVILWGFGQRDEGEFVIVDNFPVLYKGTSTRPNGDIHCGTFDIIEDCFSVIREGKIIFNSGDVHEGIFSSKHCIPTLEKGKITFVNGVISDGYFKFEDNTLFLTEGKKIFPTETQEGLFENGTIIMGTISRYNGDIMKGKFLNGFISEGKYIFADGSIFDGVFEDHKLKNGTITSSDGNKVDIF